jgi:Zn-dependent M28 family amino/carboxypeptidase
VTISNLVVFNFNNLEEFGLFGARIFAMNQDWFPEVKAFINIEGAGHGGREIIFRANNYDVIKAYADSAPHPHANVIGADVFKLGVLQSDTDYTVYAYGYGVPGLDMAFYKGRGFYHTTRDNVNETTPGMYMYGTRHVMSCQHR